MVDATANDVLLGKIYYDNAGFPHTGKLALIGTAEPTDVVAGKTYYKDNAQVIQTGVMVTSGGRKRVTVEKESVLLEPSLLLNAVLLLKEQKRRGGEVQSGDV